LVFPDDRHGLNPYSLICSDCGNYRVFYYDVSVKAKVTLKNDSLVYNYGREINRLPFNKKTRIAMIMERHRDHGAALWDNIEEEKRKLSCGKCSSDDIVLYGDVISECYANRCIGCFKCGGAFNSEHIEEYCKQCISLRSMMCKDGEDSSLFFMTLDMDLFCDSCPIEAVRLEYGITGDTIKKEVSGKLV